MKQGLGDSEPIFTLFTWFFPLQMFAAHIEELKKKKPGPASSRHYIPWDLGTFLRFLGILIRTSIMPVPNLEWNWRWPKHLPRLDGVGCAKQWMSEVVFMRYWKYACIPGVFGGVEDNEIDEEGRTALYQAVKILLQACVNTWQDKWNPGNYVCCDESMIFWRGSGEVLVIYQPRKPTQYGIELKTACCADSGVCINAELTEGKLRDAEKEYRD